MDRNSTILVILAAVVLAAVAVFCLAGSDGTGEPDVGIKSELQPGDYVTGVQTVGDEEHDVFVKVVSVLDDGRYQVLRGTPEGISLVEWDHSEFVSWFSIDDPEFSELEETERGSVSTFMGLRECVRYVGLCAGDAVELVADSATGVVYTIVLGEGDGRMTYEVTGSSILDVFGPGEVPVLNHTLKPFGDLVPGDGFRFQYCDLDGEEIDEVDIEILAVDRAKGVVYIHEVGDDSVYEKGEAEFMDMFTLKPGRIDLTEVGSTILENDGVYVETTVYENQDGSKFYLGKDNYVMYMIVKLGQEAQVLRDCTLFQGCEPKDIDAPGTDVLREVPKKGDTLNLKIDTESDQMSLTMELGFVVTSVDMSAGKLTLETDFGDVLERTVEEFYGAIRTVPDEGSYDSVRMEVVHTVFGDRICSIYSLDDMDVMCIGVGSGICYRSTTVDDGMVMTTTLMDTSLILD